jgi:hypothetical protein
MNETLCHAWRDQPTTTSYRGRDRISSRKGEVRAAISSRFTSSAEPQTHAPDYRLDRKRNRHAHKRRKKSGPPGCGFRSPNRGLQPVGLNPPAAIDKNVPSFLSFSFTCSILHTQLTHGSLTVRAVLGYTVVHSYAGFENGDSWGTKPARSRESKSLRRRE